MTVNLSENKVWVDGCFDFTHHGHCGAILQARRTVKIPSEGQLYCGIHTDEAIKFNKGPTVMQTRERYEHARAIKWCSEVVEDAPYVTQKDWLDRYGCEYVVHGDDITTDADGNDCYQLMKDIGRFKVVKRTYGVSTTDIIHRMLTGKRCQENYYPTIDELKFYSLGEDGFSKYSYVFEKDIDNILVKGEVFDFDPQKSLLLLGHFDLFHIGLIEQISIAKEQNPELKIIIGLLNTEDNIMTLKERCLSILSCKYVDGIIIEPSVEKLNDEFSKILKIGSKTLIRTNKDDFSNYLTKDVIIKRIQDQKDLYIKRNASKGLSI